MHLFQPHSIKSSNLFFWAGSHTLYVVQSAFDVNVQSFYNLDIRRCLPLAISSSLLLS
jgi:hypothetical protein